MNRRDLFKRLGATAAVLTLAPLAAQTVEASANEPTQEELLRAIFADDEAEAYARGRDDAPRADVEALYRDMLANPGKYPEIEARAREMLGEPISKGITIYPTDELFDDMLWDADAVYMEPGKVMALRGDLHEVAPPTFEAIPCTRCGDPITDGYMIGDGDGAGRQFAHPECFRQFPGAYKARPYQDYVFLKEHGATEETLAAYGRTLTFEAMQADCASRGCVLERILFPQYPMASYYHSGFGGPGYLENLALDGHAARVDSWRRSLHTD